MAPCPECPYAVGDAVEKTGGDYRFTGNVVAVFAKLSGAVRVVVEDARGLLFIFNPAQLHRVYSDPDAGHQFGAEHEFDSHYTELKCVHCGTPYNRATPEEPCRARKAG